MTLPVTGLTGSVAVERECSMHIMRISANYLLTPGEVSSELRRLFAARAIHPVQMILKYRLVYFVVIHGAIFNGQIMCSGMRCDFVEVEARERQL